MSRGRGRNKLTQLVDTEGNIRSCIREIDEPPN